MFTLKQIEDEVWYAPDIGDNRDPDKEPDQRFAVRIVPMTAAEMQKLTEVHAGKVTRGSKYNWLKRYHAARDKILQRCASAVRNLNVEVVRNGATTTKSITTIDELIAFAHPDSPADKVLEELVEALKDHSKLDEGLVGKLSSPSDSRIRVTPPGAGAAPGAAGESKTGQESQNVSAAPPAAATAPTQASDSPSPPSSIVVHGPN